MQQPNFHKCWYSHASGGNSSKETEASVQTKKGYFWFQYFTSGFNCMRLMVYTNKITTIQMSSDVIKTTLERKQNKNLTVSDGLWLNKEIRYWYTEQHAVHSLQVTTNVLFLFQNVQKKNCHYFLSDATGQIFWPGFVVNDSELQHGTLLGKSWKKNMRRTFWILPSRVSIRWLSLAFSADILASISARFFSVVAFCSFIAALISTSNCNGDRNLKENHFWQSSCAVAV